MSTAKEIFSDWNTYATGGAWLNDWQKLADHFRPRKIDFYSDRSLGMAKRRTYDGMPMYMRERAANSIAAMVMPRVSRWMFAQATNLEISRDKDVRLWLDSVDQIIWSEMNKPHAQLSKSQNELFNDLVTFGTSPLLVEENPYGDGVIFKVFFLRDIAFVPDDRGELIEVGLRYRLKPRQAQRKWGKENLPAKVNEAAEKTPNVLHTYIQWIRPRTSDKGMFTYESQVACEIGPDIIGEAGFHEMPVIPFRWEPETGEFLGTSLCSMALPDASVLSAMSKTLLKAGHRAADPPGWYIDDAINNSLHNYPGGMTSVDMSVFREVGRDPIGTYPTPANLPVTRDMQNDTREQIATAFYRDILQLPADGPRMTATEIMQRREQFFAIMGPTLAWQEYSAQKIPDRVFNILQRQGMLPPPPEALRGEEIKFRVASPVERAWKQLQHSALMAAVERMGPILEAKPEFLDKWKWEKIFDDTASAYDYPESWLNSEDEFAEIMQAINEQRQMQAMAEAAPGVGKAIKDIASVGEQ